MKKDTVFILGMILGGTIAYLKRDKLEDFIGDCECKLNDIVNKPEDAEHYGTFAEDFEEAHKAQNISKK